jgi:hypothetical protein
MTKQEFKPERRSFVIGDLSINNDATDVMFSLIASDNIISFVEQLPYVDHVTRTIPNHSWLLASSCRTRVQLPPPPLVQRMRRSGHIRDPESPNLVNFS